ncbi:unnamed protein product [Thlaspi arvense]|uniref:Uncharacterized protein n=1 Tax=Thlaspi arvense TaxID=13288 RepID=A0AAU9R7B0_THLAR|nr:unnamed protein product [Thlaspi arvense]
MRNSKNSAAAMRPVKEEPMDLDNDDEVSECMMDTEQTDSSTKSADANLSNMQRIFRAAAAASNDDLDTKINHPYMMLLDSFREDGVSYLRDNPLRSIRYDVDNGGYDKRGFKAVQDKQRSREDGNTVRVTKKKNVEPRPRAEASTKKTTREAGSVLRRRECPVTEKSVKEELITSLVERNAQHNVGASEKEMSEGEVVPDENYRSHLASLVEKSKRSRTNPDKEIQVKREEDAMSMSGSDIVAVQDRPFGDEEDSPFVPSKSCKVVDLEEESDGDQPNSWFKKEIMNVLKQPYNEEEYDELYEEASVRRVLTKHVELRDGRDFSCPTGEKKPSYLDLYPKFKKKIRMLHETKREKDRRIALNLLRGFIFYLTKVARHDAFKPWLNRECLNITCS